MDTTRSRRSGLWGEIPSRANGTHGGCSRALMRTLVLAIVAGTAADARAQFHGISHRAVVPEPSCEGGLTQAFTRATNADDFGDVLLLHQCFHRLTTVSGEVRVPATGSLPAVDIGGNAVALGDLATGPWLLGPPGLEFSFEWDGVIYELPEDPNLGRVVFEQNAYVVQVGDPAHLPMTSVVTVQDLCNEGGGECSTDPVHSQFNAQITIVDQGIVIETSTDLGDPPQICEGSTTDVTFTDTVTNTGNVALANLEVTSTLSGCDPTFVDGDDDLDGELDVDEIWTYECTVPITGETTNTATVTSETVETVSACAAQDTDSVTITEIERPQCAISGPTLVCPGETEITFTVAETSEPPLAVALFAWTIEGAGLFCDGSNTATGDTVCVQTTDVCGEGFQLTVTATSAAGCAGTCAVAVAFDELLACPQTCRADLDASGEVDFDDLLAVLQVWGACPQCPEDLDCSGEVGFIELLLVLGTWGPCP